MTATPRRRSRAPLLLALLLVAVCASLVVVVSGDWDGYRDGDDGPVAIDDETTSSAVDGRRHTGAPSAADVGRGGDVESGVTRSVAGGPYDEDPDVIELRAAESEAQRRVFEDDLRDSDPMKPRKYVGGSVGGGIGNSSPPVAGRVLDAATGEPIEGAEIVSLLAKDDGWARRWMGATSDADGAFRVRTSVRRNERPFVLVRAPGYRSQRVARGDVTPEWRLERIDGPDRGTIRGRAETPDGAPLAGLLLVAMKSEHGDGGDQYAWCDANGSYELQGVRPGRWRLSLERESEVEVAVVAGGLATARLIAERPDAKPPERPGSDRRAVEVTGLPDGTTLRADAGANVGWRSVVRDGVARFELPFGIWVLTVDRRDGAVMAITVHDEPGLQREAFVADKGGE